MGLYTGNLSFIYKKLYHNYNFFVLTNDSFYILKNIQHSILNNVMYNEIYFLRHCSFTSTKSSSYRKSITLVFFIFNVHQLNIQDNTLIYSVDSNQTSFCVFLLKYVLLNIFSFFTPA